MLRIASFAPRRLLQALGSHLTNRRLMFAVTALAVLNAKFVHIYDHMGALYAHVLRLWGYSFFAQDILLLVVIRLLLDHWVSGLVKSKPVVYIFTSLLMVYNIVLGIVSVSFYIVTGSEIHWRNIGVAGDATSRALMLTGAISFVVVVCLTFFLGWLLQDFFYGLFGIGADIINWPLTFTWRLVSRFILRRAPYSQVPQQDIEYASKPLYNDDDSSSEGGREFSSAEKEQPLVIRFVHHLLTKWGVQIAVTKLKAILNILAYVFITISLVILLGLTIARPDAGSLTFLSWTAALLPYVDFSSASPTLDKIQSVYGTGIQHTWDRRSALVDPIPLHWLPKDKELVGFEDWHRGREHYSAAADPLKISNLDQPPLEPLREKIKDLPVRHVVLFLLESTRNDIWPIKKDGLIWNRLMDTWPDKKFPEEALERLATLTPTANFITGDYDDGFKHDEASKKKRGGVHFTSASTAGTYTLKSMVGTLCGIGPLLADFNLDFQNHIYQPCLPHIFDALNTLNHTKVEGDRPYASDKWHSYFYQAATLDYDNHGHLMSAIGFAQENTIDREYLRSDAATHGPVTLPNINTFAFEEDPLEDYFRDVFVSAKEKEERVFLTHITTTSHHAFAMPEKEKYIPLGNGIDELSHYVNAVGYDDRWTRKILNLLDDQGIANETLVIFLGDHGLSMPENDMASPYYNPSIGIDHVPMILSHPLLPAFDVDDAVHSSQILPTILDVLLETGSLDKASTEALTDLVHNYEGQSLIRPIRKINEETGQGNWQFTVVNPGQAVLTVRDARFPERHLVVPIVNNVEWRLSNITDDPREQNSVMAFDFVAFVQGVEQRFGKDIAAWVEEGAFISRWWVDENSKRWRFGPYKE